MVLDGMEERLMLKDGNPQKLTLEQVREKLNNSVKMTVTMQKILMPRTMWVYCLYIVMLKQHSSRYL